MRTKSLAGFTAAALAAAALAGCAPATSGEPQGETPAPVTVQEVKMAIVGVVTNAPIYLAQEKGWFEEAGIDLQLETMAGASVIVPSLVNGQVDVGNGDIIAVVQAADKGIEVRGIFGSNSGAASVSEVDHITAAMLAKSDSGIVTAADLAGRTLAVNTLRGLTEITAREAIRSAGGDDSQVSFVEMPFPDMLPALQSDRVDAIYVIEPFASIGKKQGLEVFASPWEATMASLPVAMYFAQPDYVEANAEVLDRLRSVIDRAHDYVNENPDEVRRIVPTFTKITPEVAAVMALPNFTLQYERSTIEALMGLVEEYGLVDNAPAIDDIFATVVK